MSKSDPLRCRMDKEENKLGPLLKRMAELNAEANTLSNEIDEHLSHRASTTWESGEGADESEDSATG